MKLYELTNQLFNHPGLRKTWLRIRFPAGILIVALMFPFVRQEWFWIGLSVSMFGEAIQLWCFASLHKGKEVARYGPYACVRNPMYLGRYFIVLGFILLLGTLGLWLLLPYTVLYWFYMRNRVAREEVYLKPVLGSEYEAYCREVNRFLPSLKGVDRHAFYYWNWQWFTGNNGPLNALAMVAVYVVIYCVSVFLITS